MKNLVFYHGPVGVGRTTELIKMVYNYESIGRKKSVLVYNYTGETRYGKGYTGSESGLKVKTIPFDESFNFHKELKTKIVDDDVFNDKIELVLIDEAHFLTEGQVNQLAKVVSSDFSVSIYCFGLRTNFKGYLFDGSKRLFEVATKIKEMHKLCWCGKKATMNAKIDKSGNITKQGEEGKIQQANYKALCLRHFIKGTYEGKGITQNTAEFTYVHGPMGSGKSLECIKTYYHYKDIGRLDNILVYNHSSDIRHGTGVVASKCGLKIPSLEYNDDTDFLEIIKSQYDKKKQENIVIYHILVDEAQFLNKKQVTQLAKVSMLYNIHVTCYGLRTNFLGHLFEGSRRLFEVATNIKEMKKLCWCGNTATMNARIVHGEVAKKGEERLIGGNETYQSLCLNHYINGETA